MHTRPCYKDVVSSLAHAGRRSARALNSSSVSPSKRSDLGIRTGGVASCRPDLGHQNLSSLEESLPRLIQTPLESERRLSPVLDLVAKHV